MALAQQAFVARAAGDYQLARDLALQALPFDQEASGRIPRLPASEPSRSIIFQSAASLAYQAGDLDLAERLIHDGMSGYPPPRVRQNLRDLLETVTAATHLSTRGIELQPNEFQLALAGGEIGSGRMSWMDLRRRADSLFQMLEKSARRLAHGDFGSRVGAVNPFVPFVAAPRAGSFAMTVGMGYRTQQLSLLATPDQVIDSVLENVQLANANDFTTLRSRIIDEDYFTHFVQHARLLAPDGDRVTLVALTTPRQSVALERSRVEMSIAIPRSDVGLAIYESDTPVLDRRAREGDQDIIQGILGEALLSRSRIKVGNEERSITCTVREGTKDLVKQFFGDPVEATVLRERRRWVLVDILPLDG